jgi:fatty-acyl-CoA synthase
MRKTAWARCCCARTEHRAPLLARRTGVDANGWFHSGDLAQVAADGSWRIVGRAKDMIISGGENIYPAEIENALAAHPDVAECAVVGLADARWGEAVVAAVVPRDGWAGAGARRRCRAGWASAGALQAAAALRRMLAALPQARRLGKVQKPVLQPLLPRHDGRQAS